MSELIQKNDGHATIRWKLLSGVSALALCSYISAGDAAKAEDASRPSIWLEVDGQFSQQNSSVETYTPSFLLASPFDATSHTDLEKGLPTIWDKGARISFQSDGSGWVFAASIRYGKSARHETRNQITAQLSSGGFQAFYDAYQNIKTGSTASHTILDFQAGKDVGLGRFGSDGNSVFSVGMRYVQFNARSNIVIRSQPTNIAPQYGSYHRFYAISAAERKFAGIGPSLSWEASATMAGNSATGSITLDWGANGALLFGRQRAQTHHQTTDVLHVPYTPTNMNSFVPIQIYQHIASPPARSRRVTVPNLGGFAAVSWRYADAKVSLGYRADMFFGAIDGGIDAAKKENRGFYGPFASISVGIGD